MAPRYKKNPNKGKKYTGVVPDLPVTYRPEGDEMLRQALPNERPKLPDTNFGAGGEIVDQAGNVIKRKPTPKP